MPRIVDLSVEIENFMPAHQTMPLADLQALSHPRGMPRPRARRAGRSVHLGDRVPRHAQPCGDPCGCVLPYQSGRRDDRRNALDMFMGKAVALDFTHVPDLGDIDVADMEAAEKKSGVKIDGHIVLLNTGLHRRHYPNATAMTSNPGLTAAATHWLADKGSRLHGVEGPSTDRPNSPAFPSHRVCRDRESPTTSGCATSRNWSARASSISRGSR